MKTWQQALRDSALPGALAAAATAATAAGRGRADSASALAPLNAVSHFLWGDRAAHVRRATLKETGIGVAVNSAASVFWATVFQKLFGEAVERRGVPAALLGGAAVAGLAYLTDYHLVPKRLTPGYEKRVSGRSLALIFGALGLSLGAGALLARRRR
jgi:hypothetical protein